MKLKTRLLLSLLMLSGALPAQAIEWQIPSTESIRQAVSDHKLATYSLAGTAACAAVTVSLLKTDYNAVQFGDARFYWDWNTIDATHVNFPNDFIFGAATSAYQAEGNCTNTDWWHWEQEQIGRDNGFVTDFSGKACDQQNKYKEDIALMHEMGLGIYRFSLAWDKIQPTADTFDNAAIEHYKDMCRELAKYGIKAHIGFHHYADPKWFADLGGFTREENIHYFANFCAHVLEAFAQDPEVNSTVLLWSTFNSPSGYVFHKYHTGRFPPGIQKDTQLCMTALKNMMEAHVQAYQLGKAKNPNAQIGILKNIMQMDPWRPWHPLDNFACTIAQKMTDSCIFSFFTTGRFIAKIPFDNAPFMANVEHTNINACNSLDFIGLNYYGHSYIKNMTRFLHPGEIHTKNPNYALYPEGLCRALHTITEKIVEPIEQLTRKHLPIYVTENGTALDNPEHRLQFFQRYMYALDRARHEGCDVRGYSFWSFMDNYEWGAYNKQYGLVHVDFDSPELTRTVKDDIGTQYYLHLIRKNRPLMPTYAATSGL